MTGGQTAELDFIEELRLRCWARENYVPAEQRLVSWHPVVHHEMAMIEQERGELDVQPSSVLAGV